MAIISKYLFDGTFQDSVGSVHGTANGGMDASATDGERTVVVFDGTDDYIDFGSDFRFNTEDFSFSMWIKPQSSQGEWARIWVLCTMIQLEAGLSNKKQHKLTDIGFNHSMETLGPSLTRTM